jgi:hypothetical protein
MDRDDFIKLIGADSGNAEYLPVAFLLKSAYAGLGYFNSSVNQKFEDVCVLLNARLLNLGQASAPGRAAIRTFAELIEEISLGEEHGSREKRREPEFGEAIPLVAVALSEFAVIYPVSQIQALLAQSKNEQGSRVPTFFNLDKSEILRLLRVKLW